MGCCMGSVAFLKQTEGVDKKFQFKKKLYKFLKQKEMQGR